MVQIILEAGLGGRLDATNIVTPAVSIITSVGCAASIRGKTRASVPSEERPLREAGMVTNLSPGHRRGGGVLLKQSLAFWG